MSKVTYINQNPHLAYVDNGEDLQKIRSGEELAVDEDSVFARNLAETPGLVNLSDLSQKESKAVVDAIEGRASTIQGPGPAAFPAIGESDGPTEAEKASGTVTDYGSLKVGDLKKLAAERNVEVKGSGKKGAKTKGDYVKALSSGTVTTQDVPAAQG